MTSSLRSTPDRAASDELLLRVHSRRPGRAHAVRHPEALHALTPTPAPATVTHTSSPTRDLGTTVLRHLNSPQVLSKDGGKLRLEQVVEFAEAALDGQSSGVGGDGGAKSGGGCDNAACIPVVTITASGLPADGSNSASASPSGSVPVATTIDVSASPDSGLGYAFYEWLAQGTMINGCLGSAGSGEWPLLVNK